MKSHITVVSPKQVEKLIETHQAMVRVIESNQGKFENWIHELSQILFPSTERERGVKKLKPDSNRKIILNPLTGKKSERKVSEIRGAYKPGSHTKKMNLTLLSKDGKTILFNVNNVVGAEITRNFDTGLLFERSKIAWHGTSSPEIKFIFPRDANTNGRGWIEGQGDIPKAITFEEVIQTQNTQIKKKERVYYNDCLGRTSVDAVCGIFSQKNFLTPRLNALHNKYLTLEWLNKDLPVFIITPETGHFYYTQEQQIKDIIAALKRDKHTPAYQFALALVQLIPIYDKNLFEKLKSPDLAKLHPYFQLYASSPDFKKIKEICEAKAEPSLLEQYRILQWILKTPDKKIHDEEEKKLSQQQSCESSDYLAKKLLHALPKQSWLLHSVHNQQYEVTEYLLRQQGQELTKQELSEAFPYIIRAKQYDLIHLILNLKPDMEVEFTTSNLKKNTALQLAVTLNDTPIRFIQSICDAGGKILQKNSNGKNTFELAIQHNYFNVVDYFLESTHFSKELKESKENKENVSHSLGKFLLFLLDKKEQLLAKKLIHRLPNICKSWDFEVTQNTPLHLCLNMPRPDRELILLLYDKDNTKLAELNKEGESPLLIGIKKGHMDLLYDVCQENHFVAEKHSLDQLIKVFDLLLENKQYQFLILLLRQRPDLQDHSHKSISCLFSKKTPPDLDLIKVSLAMPILPSTIKKCINPAINAGHFTVVDYFINHLPSEQKCDHLNHTLGETLLFLVANNRQALAKLLIQKQPIIHKYWDFNENKNTVLHLCMQMEKPDPELVLMLCDKDNIKLVHENKEGETPLLVAVKKEHFDLITMLLQKNPFILTDYSQHQLDKIAKILYDKNQYDLLDFLLKSKPDWDPKNTFVTKARLKDNPSSQPQIDDSIHLLKQFIEDHRYFFKDCVRYRFFSAGTNVMFKVSDEKKMPYNENITLPCGIANIYGILLTNMQEKEKIHAIKNIIMERSNAKWPSSRNGFVNTFYNRLFNILNKNDNLFHSVDSLLKELRKKTGIETAPEHHMADQKNQLLAAII
jgi:ankyrin repeat protein